MKKSLRIMIFLFILGAITVLASEIVTKKYGRKQGQDATAIVRGYYEEPEDTIDVLYLGSSYMRNGISPLEIWHDYGITGYSRASAQQAPIISYYMAEEAFKKQDLKAVVFEAATLVQSETSETNDYDLREAKLHEVIDYMKWSPSKLKLAKEIVDNSELSYLDLLAPIYRYHDRWSELEEQDFKNLVWDKRHPYKGQYVTFQINSFNIREHYMEPGYNDEEAVLDETTASYVLRMKELCEGNGAELILLRAPHVSWDDGKHNIVEQFAEENGLEYLDYCTEELREAMKFDPKTDTTDRGSHLNLIGAIKLAKHFGNYLKDNLDLEDKRGDERYAQWDEDYETYKYELLGKEVAREGNLSNYLDLINQPNYLVLVAAKSDTGTYFSDELHGKMEKLGLSEDLSGTLFMSYIGIADNGECIYEETSTDPLTFKGELAGRYFNILSDARRGSNSSVSIQIDGEENAKDADGLNFVVYDKELQRVIDAKRFNTGSTGQLYTERERLDSMKGIFDYFTTISSDRYAFVLSVKKDAGKFMSSKVEGMLKETGLQADLRQYAQPLAAIVDGGDIVAEETGGQSSSASLSGAVGDVEIQVISDCAGEGGGSSILINGEEYSPNKNGINVVVYDKYAGKAADARVYDTGAFSYLDIHSVRKAATMQSFLDRAYKKDYSIVLLADGDPSAYMTPGMQTALASKELGLSGNEGAGNYVAVVDGLETVYESWQSGPIEHSMEIGSAPLRVSSGTGGAPVIEINGINYAEDEEGIKAVVYDKANECVIAALTWDG